MSCKCPTRHSVSGLQKEITEKSKPMIVASSANLDSDSENCENPHVLMLKISLIDARLRGANFLHNGGFSHKAHRRHSHMQ